MVVMFVMFEISLISPVTDALTVQIVTCRSQRVSESIRGGKTNHSTGQWMTSITNAILHLKLRQKRATTGDVQSVSVLYVHTVVHMYVLVQDSALLPSHATMQAICVCVIRRKTRRHEDKDTTVNRANGGKQESRTQSARPATMKTRY